MPWPQHFSGGVIQKFQDVPGLTIDVQLVMLFMNKLLRNGDDEQDEQVRSEDELDAVLDRLNGGMELSGWRLQKLFDPLRNRDVVTLTNIAMNDASSKLCCFLRYKDWECELFHLVVQRLLDGVVKKPTESTDDFEERKARLDDGLGGDVLRAMAVKGWKGRLRRKFPGRKIEHSGE